MTRQQLLKALRATIKSPEYDTEEMHIKMDELLLEYIGDPKVSELYNGVTKYYA